LWERRRGEKSEISQQKKERDPDLERAMFLREKKSLLKEGKRRGNDIAV